MGLDTLYDLREISQQFFVAIGNGFLPEFLKTFPPKKTVLHGHAAADLLRGGKLAVKLFQIGKRENEHFGRL